MERDLRYFLYVCTFFGTYVKYNSEHNKSGKFQHLAYRLQQCYPYALVSIVLTASSYGIKNSDLEESALLSWIVATIVHSSQILANLCIYLEALHKREQHARFLHTLSAVDELLRFRLQARINNHVLLRRIRCELSVLMVFSLFGLVIYAITQITLKVIGYYWFGVWPNLCMRMRVLQLIVYAEVLCAQQRQLNRKLNQLIAHQMTPKGTHLLDLHYARLENVQLLWAMREIHALLYAAIEQLNDFSGWSLVTIVSCYFLDCTFHIYGLLLGLDGARRWDVYVTAISTVLPLGALFGKLCWVCQQCKSEDELTRKLLNRLIGIRVKRERRRYEDSLDNISLQLQHERIQITAKKFFTFDLPFMMSIFVTLLTYLIILVQFWKNDKSNHN